MAAAESVSPTQPRNPKLANSQHQNDLSRLGRATRHLRRPEPPCSVSFGAAGLRFFYGSSVCCLRPLCILSWPAYVTSTWGTQVLGSG
jgi:hypothetical protein